MIFTECSYAARAQSSYKKIIARPVSLYLAVSRREYMQFRGR